ncbi:MAG: VWA domain-containing protein [Eubacteriaceae bacterium]|nr:VWA domain-containing protein [Eubacteriaceae bacterium]
MEFSKKKAFIKLLIYVFVSNILICALMSTPVAASAYGDTKYNIMLVIDRSGSLETNDALENRYEAIKYLFETLPASGNEIGAIVFNSSVVVVSPLKPINSQKEKQEILEAIKANPVQGGTDIGAAILEAAKALIKRGLEQDGNYEPAIILFTDGITDTPDPQRSFSMKDEAISICLANNIQVFGIFLDKDGNIKRDEAVKNKQEVFDIVRGARGIANDPVAPRNSDGSLNDLERRYSEIESPDDITGSFSNLVHLLIDGNAPALAETVPIVKECIIPGFGASELNISVRYHVGVFEKISISIERPDGSIVSQNDGAATISDTFFNAKILDPSPGKWVVRVDRAGDSLVTEGIEVIPDIVISTNVAAVLNMLDNGNGILLNKPVEFVSWLEQGGIKASQNNQLAFYECELTLLNTITGETKEIPMKLGNEGIFVAEGLLGNFGQYIAYAAYTCDRIQFRSQEIVISATNQPPVVKNNPVKVRFGYNILTGNSCKIDLSKHVFDPENGKLSYSILSSDYENTSADGSGLFVYVTGKGVGTIQMAATDEQGATTNFTVELASSNNTWLIAALAIVLIAAGIFVLHAYRGGYINAELRLSIEYSQNQAINEKYEYGSHTIVRLNSFNKPSVSLLEVCLEMANKENTKRDVEKELSALFGSNRNMLASFKFYRVPGFDRNKFIFAGNDGEIARRTLASGLNASVAMVEGEKLKVACQPRSAGGNKRANDYDD